MIELLLWILFGTLSGWIGYLITRTHESASATPYITMGTLGAVVGGYATRDIGASEFALNPPSLFIALGTAVLGVLFVSFLDRVSAS